MNEPKLCPDCWELRPCGCDELDRYVREQHEKTRTRVPRTARSKRRAPGGEP